MTQRRCCCGSGGDGCCFTFSVTASHIQYCSIQCTVTNCSKPGIEPCATIESFSVSNAYTSTLAALAAQQFVVSTEPDPGEQCRCYGQRCVYTWNPSGINFTRTVNFTMGCTGSIPQSSSTGQIGVSRQQAPECPGVAYPACGCCGPPFLYLVIIQWSATIPTQTVTGACGTVEYWNLWDLGAKNAWSTTFRAYYCWDSRTPCTLTLKALEGNAITPAASTGPGIPGDDCDCNDGLGNSIITTPCNPPALAFCAPFTAGNAALMYQLAGQPPLTLTGSSCACP